MKSFTLFFLALLISLPCISQINEVASHDSDFLQDSPDVKSKSINVILPYRPLLYNKTLEKPASINLKSDGKDFLSNSNLSDIIDLNNGNVRIGVGTAEQKLHVFGNTKISDSGSSDGKLFIGTTPTDETSAAGYNLLVGGKGIMTELKVNVTNSWPDYVFEPSYELMTLDELEQFINNNKHLPGIPSASQVEKDNGFHVGEMQKSLLEKIEELTLHLIDLKKENEEMKSELIEIKKQISNSNFTQNKD